MEACIKTSSDIFRQGDVAITRVSEMPKCGELVKFDKFLTIAFGEKTFHHHSFYPTKEVNMECRKVGNVYFVKTDVDVPLRHQEHKELIIPAGIWTIGSEEQYNPWSKAMQRTLD